MRATLVLVTALALLGAACNGGGLPTTTALEEGAAAVDVGEADDRPSPPPDDERPAAAAQSSGGGPPAPQPAGSPEAGHPDDDLAAPEVVDLRRDHPVVARPGRWAVGEAGFVAFDLTSDGLVLLDVISSEGWTARVDEESDDEIEVDFTRDGTHLEFEAETDDGVLEVDIRADVRPAAAGAYDLGAAGSFEFALESGRLVLRDVVVADGWQLEIDEESSDEIELELRKGPERWEVEVELDGGVVELEIDYQVRGAAGT